MNHLTLVDNNISNKSKIYWILRNTAIHLFYVLILIFKIGQILSKSLWFKMKGHRAII